MANQWIIDVKNGLRNHNLDSFRRSEEVSIYEFPEFLVQLKQSAYFPQMVRLGPLHHDPTLSQMHTHKLHATRKMFSLPEEDLEREVIGPILALVPRVRKCYRQNIEYQDGYLAWMLTLDACFILEIFRALDSKANSDHSFFNRNTIVYTVYPILTDILMLENQIPLFVLVRILGLQLKIDEESAFTKLCKLFDDARIKRLLYPFKEGAFKEKAPPRFEIVSEQNNQQSPFDTKREFIFPSASELHKDTDQRCPVHTKREIIIPTASELRRAGIKFTKMEGKLMEISIKKNRFHLPRIRISSGVETLLHNLMPFEICEADDRCVISRYVHVMYELIHSERDVSVLRKAEIIKSYLGSDREVADLFKTLSKGITRSYKDPFAKVREDAHKHYHSKIKVMVAEFTDDHRSSPWITVSVIAACLILFFAAVQTIFSLHRKLLTN
ncbi:hypothetical protein SUGI_0957160 [Cryptomeria japonica]|nr:hypothetical protein SUGI_0957160 [Cryptomeria japonica]